MIWWETWRVCNLAVLGMCHNKISLGERSSVIHENVVIKKSFILKIQHFKQKVHS
jgi:hypothetical protein